MKAIATSVAIFTGVSNAADGGAKLASTTVATRSIVNVSGAKRERVWRMMGAICRMRSLIRNSVLRGFSYHVS